MERQDYTYFQRCDRQPLKSPQMSQLLDVLKSQMKDMCSEGEEMSRCMAKLYRAFQQFVDLQKADDSVHDQTFCGFDLQPVGHSSPDFNDCSRASTPRRSESQLRVEEWIPNVLVPQTPCSDTDTLDLSNNSLDALDLCHSRLSSPVAVYNQPGCCIVDKSAVNMPQRSYPVTGQVTSASPVTGKAASPITVSSGYDSDNMPTCEEEIDTLLHGGSSHRPRRSHHRQHSTSGGPHSFSNLKDFTQKPSNIPRTRSCMAVSTKSSPGYLNARSQERNTDNATMTHSLHPVSRNKYCLKRALPRKHCGKAPSPVSDFNSHMDTYLEPVPLLNSPASSNLNDSLSSIHCWETECQWNNPRSDLGYDDSFSSLSDTSSLECSVRWNSGVSVSVDSGRGSWCSQDSVRHHHDAEPDSPVEENIYETIPDDIPDASPTSFAHSNQTYDKIDCSAVSAMPSPQPPALPARNNRPHLRHHPHSISHPILGKIPPSVEPKSLRRATTSPHIDDIIKNSDIVDMTSYHVYTVKDVLDSVNSFAGHLLQEPNEGDSEHRTTMGKKCSVLREMSNIGKRSNSLLKPRKSNIEYFKCGDVKPTSVVERFYTEAADSHYAAQWHVDVTGVAPTYC